MARMPPLGSPGFTSRIRWCGPGVVGRSIQAMGLFSLSLSGFLGGSTDTGTKTAWRFLRFSSGERVFWTSVVFSGVFDLRESPERIGSVDLTGSADLVGSADLSGSPERMGSSVLVGSAEARGSVDLRGSADLRGSGPTSRRLFLGPSGFAIVCGANGDLMLRSLGFPVGWRASSLAISSGLTVAVSGRSSKCGLPW